MSRIARSFDLVAVIVLLAKGLIQVPQQVRASLGRSAQPGDIHERVESIGARLGDSLRALLDAIPGGPYRAQELGRKFGINKDLSNRAVTASLQLDPIAAAHQMPGPAPLRRLVRAAAKQKIDPQVVKQTELAIDEYESFLRSEVGDRSGLDAILSAWLPEAREKFEATHKQGAFRAISNLLGMSTDVNLFTWILYPATNSDLVDAVMLIGAFCLKRLRPGITLRFGSRALGPLAQGMRLATLEGDLVDAAGATVLLPQFCSSPRPRITPRQQGKRINYFIEGESIGPRSGINLVMGELRLGGFPRFQDADPPRNVGVAVEVLMPARVLIFDLLLHEKVWPGCSPQLLMYNTVYGGLVNPNDAERDVDRWDLHESIQPLGSGITRFGTTEVPNYPRLLRYVCGKVEVEGAKLRGYRCRIEYPVYSSQICLNLVPAYKTARET